MILALAWTDFKLRYHGSFLGYLWTLIKPLIMFGIIYVVFSTIMNVPVEHYQVYLLLGIILWNFFLEGTQMGLSSLLAKAGLISKVYFPRVLIIIASTISSLITFLLNFLIFLFFLFLNRIEFDFSMLFFPVYLLELYLMILGISLILSVLYIRFRDLSHIWEILLQIGFWATPIIYPLELIPAQYHSLIYLNPLTRIIHYSRVVFLQGHVPDLKYNFIAFMASLSIFILGCLIFRKYNKNLIEYI